jgi:hypothetical protein
MQISSPFRHSDPMLTSMESDATVGAVAAIHLLF